MSIQEGAGLTCGQKTFKIVKLLQIYFENIFKAEWGQGSSLGLSKVLFSPDRGLNNTLKQQIIFFIHYVNSDKLNMILTKIVDCISF